MKFRKMAMLFACLTAVATACGGNDNTDNGNRQVDKEQPAAVGTEPITLNIFQTISTARTQEWFDTTYGSLIKAKYPHLTLNFIPRGPGQTEKELVATGQSIDIMMVSQSQTFSSFIDYRLQADLSDLIKTYKYDLTKLYPTTLDIQKAISGGEAIYGLPVIMNAAPFFYNKDLFDKFGVPYPNDNMTWDDIYEVAQKLTRTEGGVQYRGLVMNSTLSVEKNQMSLSYADSKTHKALADEGWKRWTELMTRFYKIPGNEVDLATISGAAQTNLFAKDKIAAMYASPGNPGLTTWDMNWDMIAFPSFPEAPGIGPQATPTYLYIPGTSKHRDAAFRVIQYLTSEEVQMIRSKLGDGSVLQNESIRKSFGIDVPQYKGKNINAVVPKQYAKPMAQTPYNAIVQKQYIAAFDQVATGKKDVNTALREAAELANKEIASAKQAEK
ncbi:extracellular solute-binding protein [Paenibacillus mesophilus]|uniref:ABC transporter substrate-binding protein n=1 Tax=Paenibacillus mesophilus TaxID=2582849 RepID=UPI00110E3C61|nr:extracellular solute-binding protein [Paenibacillus mesophilus]TMV49912.1 extracellular solute-binding protein [Paenibacillus mesophilus]